MNNEIKLGDIVVFKTGNRAFEVIGKYIVPDDRLWRVDAITENDPPTPDRNRKYRLVAVDCPNVMLDEIPEIYVESYSEKLERELEEQRKEVLKMNRNEIKQGDKVMVSKDAPKVYLSSVNNLFKYHVCKVEEVDGDSAIIRYTDIGIDRWLAIPTKYLVKVDAEAKEPKYHKDDKVCINKSSLKHGLRGEILTIIGVDVSDRTYYVQSRRMRSPIWLREDEISPYTEPTEQTEAEKPNHTIKIPVEVNLTDSYWDATPPTSQKRLH